MAKLQDILNKTDVIESYKKERLKTKWRFYKLTNLTVVAALLKDVPMVCKDAVLPKLLLKNQAVIHLTLENNTRQSCRDNLVLFDALALHSHGNQRLEEKTSIFFNSMINRKDKLSHIQFKEVHLKEIPVSKDLLTLKILLHDRDIVVENIIGEHDRRSWQELKKLCD